MAMKTLKAGILLLFSLVLSGCGVEGGLNYATALARGVISQGASTGAPARSLPRETIDAAGVPLILVEVPDRQASATMVQVGQNGDVRSWSGSDGVGVSMTDAGLLVSTRGYGGDILSADVSEVHRALLRPRAAFATRTMRFLDGQGRDFARSYACDYSSGGRQQVEIFERTYQLDQVVERCLASDHGFENLYWLDAGGTIWKSIQYAGPHAGSLLIERLHE
jgi:hypothetical protein